MHRAGELVAVYLPEVADVMGLKGFRLVAAMTVVAELGDLGRFSHPRQLMGDLGLVPGEDRAGQRRRQSVAERTRVPRPFICSK